MKILEDIRAGNYSHHWAPLEVRRAGIVAVFQVSSQPLESKGLFVTPAPKELAAIHSELEGLPLTPFLLDLRYDAAINQNHPKPKWYKLGIGMSTPQAVKDHTARVKKDLPCGLDFSLIQVGNGGKHYIYPLSKEELYGWHLFTPNARYSGVRLKAGVSGLPFLKVIQGVSDAHEGLDEDIVDGYHYDYSMTVVMIHARCTINGVEMSTEDVFNDPKLAPICWGVDARKTYSLVKGVKGPRVKALQVRLNVLGATLTEDGDYGSKTQAAVKLAQVANGMLPTGVADYLTIQELNSPDAKAIAVARPYPPKPAFGYPNLAWREQVLGRIAFRHTPTVSRPEAITIISGPAVVSVVIPQLVGIANSKGQVWWIASRVNELKALFKAWEDAGLMKYVLSWDGSLARRLKRGKRSSNAADLSDHAWGSAFDINARWNPYRRTPATWDEKGTVFPLVAIANEHRFYCGLHFRSNSDAMHFALCR